MRRMGVWRLGIVALAGASIAGCELIIGDGPFGDGNTTTSSTSSGMGGLGGTGGTGGSTSSGHTGGGGSPPAPLPGTAVWAHSLGTTGSDVVNAMAFGEVSGHLYITGKSDSDGDFGCDAKTGNMDPAGGGYLIEVDDTGHCVWGLFFGKDTEGTGLGLDASENIALTGTFQATLNVLGYSNGKPAVSGFVVRINNNGGNKTLGWGHSLSGDSPNTATTTAVVMDTTQIFVSGYMSGKLDIDTTTVVTNPTGGEDGFIVKCDVAGTNCALFALISGEMIATMNQEVLGLALSPDGMEVSFAGSSTGKTGFNSAILTPPPAAGDITDNAIFGSFKNRSRQPAHARRSLRRRKGAGRPSCRVWRQPSGHPLLRGDVRWKHPVQQRSARHQHGRAGPLPGPLRGRRFERGEDGLPHLGWWHGRGCSRPRHGLQQRLHRWHAERHGEPRHTPGEQQGQRRRFRGQAGFQPQPDMVQGLR
ncbi:MAG: hypothetical protein QM820_60400 [Minicystis sp.]